MKKWIGSRLNRKLCLCFLIVSLIPLCLVYFYINSRYSEKLRSDAVVLNQLAEKNTAILLEDYLTKTCRRLSEERWGRLIIIMPASFWKRRCG